MEPGLRWSCGSATEKEDKGAVPGESGQRIDYSARIEAARTGMRQHGWSALWVVPSGDMEFLTGIGRGLPRYTDTHMPGDWLHALLLTASRAVVILPRMTTIFGDPTAGKPWLDEVVVLDESPALAAPVYRLIRCLGLERGIWGVSKKTPAVTLLRLGQEFPGLGFVEAEPLLSRLRQVKDPVAVQIMRRACEVTDRVFASVLGQVQYGMSGREVAELVDRQARVMGAQGMSFPTGVMVGGCPSPASSFGSGCTLAFDFGLVVDGYCSDFGRTVYVGEPDGERLRMHRAVLEAQQAGVTALRPGVRAWEVDRAARRVLESYGWGHLFRHRLGHGIGVDVHEAPFLAPGEEAILEEGMTFTVEPSIITPDGHVIRVEDVVLVTPSGGESLTSSPRDPVVV